MQEKYSMIPYKGTEISLYSDDKDDYVSLSDIYKAFNRYSKSISVWLKSKQTLEFLNVWEKKHNPKYDPTQLSRVMQVAKQRNGFSPEAWAEMTGAIGIFSKSGKGTYAHKDIAIRFAGWLSPEFELHLSEEIQRLKEIERQKNSYELLSHEQILKLVRLKEVFKYVAHQEMIEDAHKELFAARSGSKNPFAEFNTWRNKILDIAPDVIEERIKEYCIEHDIVPTKKLLNRPKREKILMYDTYEAVRNAVWDFLSIEGEVNALNLANLVQNMIRIEKGDVIRNNETDLFHEKQDLGEYTNFKETINNHPLIKSARQMLEYRKTLEEKKKPKAQSTFNQQLEGLLNVPPPKKDK